MRLMSFAVIAIALTALPAGAATHCAVGKACPARPVKACKAGATCSKPAPTVPAGTVAPVAVPAGTVAPVAVPAGTVAPVAVPSGSKPLSLPAANAVLPP